MSVSGHRGQREVVVAQLLYAPRHATLAFARTAHRLTGSLHHVLGPRRRLKALGLRASDVRTPTDVAALETIGDTNTTAITFTSLHPNIATKNPALVPPTKVQVGGQKAVGDLGALIENMTANAEDFADKVPATDPDGTPTKLRVPIIQDGKVVGYQSSGFKTFQLNQSKKYGDQLRAAAGTAVTAGIGAVREQGDLGAVVDGPLSDQPAASTRTWKQSQGGLPQVVPYSALAKAASGVQVNVSDTSLLFGTYTTVDGGLNGNQVKLKLYNNYVRWTWVYVQYLGPGDKNLSINPGAQWPDTKYSQSLGLLPQVFTVLGIPIWDTNTITPTLNFPTDAAGKITAGKARILYAGLGNDIAGGGWRQYFPDGAYADKVAPQDEVLFPAVITGILTIGLTVFALATDLDIATTWGSLRKLIGDAPDPSLLGAVLDRRRGPDGGGGDRRRGGRRFGDV